MALRASALQTVEDCRVPLAPVKRTGLAGGAGFRDCWSDLATAPFGCSREHRNRPASPFAASLAKDRNSPNSADRIRQREGPVRGQNRKFPICEHELPLSGKLEQPSLFESERVLRAGALAVGRFGFCLTPINEDRLGAKCHFCTQCGFEQRSRHTMAYTQADSVRRSFS